MSQQPSWRKQLILATSLFVFGSAAYWLEFNHRPKQEEKAEAAKKLFALKDKAVPAFELKNGPITFALKCLGDTAATPCKPGENSKWELTSPPEAKGLKADDANANALLSAINNLSSSDVIDLKDETPEKRAALLKEYALDPASRSAPESKHVSANGTVAYIGLTHPVNDAIFTLTESSGKVDDSKVYLVPGFFKSNFDHDLTYWRDKKVVHMPSSGVTSFELEGSKGKVSAVKKDGQWTLNGTLAGDPENIESLLSSAAFLQAHAFLNDEKPALAGAKKVLTLTLKHELAKDEKPSADAPPSVQLVLFEKGSPNPSLKKGVPKPADAKLYARSTGSASLMELESGAKDKLDKGAADLRLSKLLTSVERYSVKKIEFSGKALGAEPLKLVNSEGKWWIEPEAKAAKKEAKNDKVQALLEKLSGNRIQEFLADGKIPAGQEQSLKITLGDEKDAAKRQLIFWKGGTGGKQLFARDLKSARKEAFRVDPTIADELPTSRQQLELAPAPSPSPSSSSSSAPTGTKPH